MTGRPWRAGAILIALVILLFSPRDAQARADLVRSDPGPQTVLGHPPQAIRLWFTEQVELALTRVILTDPKGTTVPTDAPGREAGDVSSVRTDLISTLGAGTYTVAWSTVALDGHPSAGKFSFRVLGQNETVDSAFAAEADAQQDSATRAATRKRTSAIEVQSDEAQSLSTTEPLRVAARAITYFTMLCIIGAVGVRLIVIPRTVGLDGSAVRHISLIMARFGVFAAVIRLAVGLLRLFIQPVLVAGLPTTDFAHRWAMVQTTDWGMVWLVQFVATVVALVGFLLGGAKGKAGWYLAAPASLALAVGTALRSHAGGPSHPAAATIVIESIHMLAVSLWLGGLLWVVTAGFASVSRVGWLLKGWVPTAIAAMVVAVLTGLATAWARLGSMAALTGTPYGTSLLVKMALSVVLILVGVRNWRLVSNAQGDGDLRSFGTWAGVELLVGALVIIVTSALVGLPVPRP